MDLFEDNLIDLIRNYPFLYKNKDKKHRSLIVKENCWREIAEKLKKTPEECKNKWRNIRDNYKKNQNKKKTGNAASVSKYDDERLKFLDASSEERECISDLNASYVLVVGEEDNLLIEKSTSSTQMSSCQSHALLQQPWQEGHSITPNQTQDNTSQTDDSISALETQPVNTDEEQENDIQYYEPAEVRPKKRIIDDKTKNHEMFIPKKRHLENDGQDEFDVYGKYVASELRNINDEYSTLIAKQYINNILIDARFGKYKQEFNTFGCNSANASDPLSSHLTPEIKIEERSHTVNTDHRSQRRS